MNDLAGKILFWNNGAGTIFGYTAEEIVGQTIVNLYPEKEQRHLAQHLQHIQSGKARRGEVQGRRKDGTLVWQDMKTSYLQTFDVHAQKVDRILYISEEITSYKQAEKEKQTSESLAQAILNSLSVMVAVRDADGNIRAYQEITVSNRGRPWQNRVVPLTVEVIPQDSKSSHVFIGDFASQRIGVGVEK